MKTKSLLFVFAIFMLACNSRATSDAEMGVPENSYKGEEANKSEMAVDTASGVTTDYFRNRPNSIAENSPGVPTVRHIVKTATIEIECKSFKPFSANVAAIVKANGGWIDAEQESQSESMRQNTLTIRVPVANFDQLVQALAEQDGILRQKQIESKDVTNAVVDIKGRLQAKEMARNRYLDLLKQAKTMEEVLQVQSVIHSITEEMESAAYNLQHMQAEAATSTISFTYYETIQGATSSYNDGLLYRLGDAVAAGAKGLMNLLIGMVVFWPLWLALGIVVVWWKRSGARIKPALSKRGNSENA